MIDKFKVSRLVEKIDWHLDNTILDDGVEALLIEIRNWLLDVAKCDCKTDKHNLPISGA